MKTFLAWLNLWHEKARLAVAIAGVAFADILIFTNLGFLGSVAESASTIYEKINADIYLTSPRSLELSSSYSFPRQRIYQVAGVPGVERVMPLYLGYLMWRNPQTHLSRGIMVYGINPRDPVFQVPELRSPTHQSALNRWDTVLIDRDSRPEFGPLAIGTKTEAGRRQVVVGEQFTLGGTFSADGNVIMSDQNYLRYFAPAPLDRIHLGLVKVQPGIDVDQTANTIRQRVPPDVKVLTKQQMMDRDRQFWIKTTSTGFIFTMGVAVSCVVGIVIVYQILYTDISNHLKQYATLKAIGYRNRYLFSIVLQEAIMLAILGYLPGLGISLGLYRLTAQAANLPMTMELGRVVSVFLLTIAMCSLSGLVSMQKVLTADPVDVF